MYIARAEAPAVDKTFTIWKLPLILMEVVVRSFGIYANTGKHQDGWKFFLPILPISNICFYPRFLKTL